jgi:transposase
MSKFRLIDRDTGFLLPPSVDEWLPERHLARFVVEVIEGLDLRAMIGRYRGCGEAAYHPRLLLGILVYGYATGVFSSRKLERATYDSVAFRFIAANQHPDHDTIAAFRRRFLPHIEALFVQVLLLAREIGVLQLGTVALDGTKIHANASRHSALSYEHASQIEAQLRAEVADLLAKAEVADQVPLPDGLSVPEELARREYEAKMTARAVKAAATGRNPRGRPPMPPIEQPGPTDQVNLTDEESRIMPVPGGGFEQCYNAQACVVAGSLLVVANHVVQAANDKQQIEPMLGKLATLPAALGQVETLLADTGYFSEANVCDGRHRSADCDGAAAAPSPTRRALRSGPAAARAGDAARGDGASAANAAGQDAVRLAQAHPRAGVRNHQSRPRFPPVPAAGSQQGPRRMEPRHHGLQPEAAIRPCRRHLIRTRPS